MKKTILSLFVGISVLSSCEVLNEASKIVTTNTGTSENNKPKLSNDEVISGLKEALSVGIKNSVNLTSVTDGFLKNSDIRLPFPPDAQKVGDKMNILIVVV